MLCPISSRTSCGSVPCTKLRASLIVGWPVVGPRLGMGFQGRARSPKSLFAPVLQGRNHGQDTDRSRTTDCPSICPRVDSWQIISTTKSYSQCETPHSCSGPVWWLASKKYKLFSEGSARCPRACNPEEGCLDKLQTLEDDAGVDYYLATKACLIGEYYPLGQRREASEIFHPRERNASNFADRGTL